MTVFCPLYRAKCYLIYVRILRQNRNTLNVKHIPPIKNIYKVRKNVCFFIVNDMVLTRKWRFLSAKTVVFNSVLWAFEGVVYQILLHTML